MSVRSTVIAEGLGGVTAEARLEVCIEKEKQRS